MLIVGYWLSGLKVELSQARAKVQVPRSSALTSELISNSVISLITPLLFSLCNSKVNKNRRIHLFYLLIYIL